MTSAFGRHLAVGLLLGLSAATGCASGAMGPGADLRPSPFPNAPSAGKDVVGARADRAATPIVDAVLQTALHLQGAPYRAGGEDPSRGFDCSGLVQYVFARHHVELPRTVEEQYRVGIKVSLSRVRRGDLVFFSTTGPGATHVGIAIGDGAFVHAPTEKGLVRVEHLDSPYWHNRFVGARRVLTSPSSDEAGWPPVAAGAGSGARGRTGGAR